MASLADLLWLADVLTVCVGRPTPVHAVDAHQPTTLVACTTHDQHNVKHIVTYIDDCPFTANSSHVKEKNCKRFYFRFVSSNKETDKKLQAPITSD